MTGARTVFGRSAGRTPARSVCASQRVVGCGGGHRLGGSGEARGTPARDVLWQ
ncbi:MAG: hypothetical protein RMJ55_19605 [Roseiflexaceae bacterium]|nr:hypothetical protein [Roseiflexus sp.]MDW8148373.1 hypothetical protein [Roseiflexaceae bacterium]MDW8215762.1 hypothetical protein [Roseiflexaceae bacterium]